MEAKARRAVFMTEVSYAMEAIPALTDGIIEKLYWRRRYEF
jgi:hypothetical protein